MDVGVVGVPVVDRDPVQPRSQISLGLGHQFAGRGPKVSQVAGVLGRDDETEVVSVVFAALGEGGVVGRPVTVEHLGGRTVAGHALPPQVSQMLDQRRGRVALSAVANDAGLDDHTPIERPGRSGGVTATPRTPVAPTAFQIERALSAPPRRTQHLPYKATAPSGTASPTIADAA